MQIRSVVATMICPTDVFDVKELQSHQKEATPRRQPSASDTSLVVCVCGGGELRQQDQGTVISIAFNQRSVLVRWLMSDSTKGGSIIVE